MRNFISKWWFVLVLLILSSLMILSGYVGLFSEALQLVVKKTFLLSFWYFTAYVIRIQRIGHIDWDRLNDDVRALYYFILLLGSAMVISWG